MKTSIFHSLLTVCLVFTCMQVNAQTLTTIYSGEKNPTEEGWTELKLDETVSPVAGTVSQKVVDGALKLLSNDADKFTQLGWFKTDLQLNLLMGYTIEIKAKVTNSAGNNAFNIQGFDNTGKGFRIVISKDYLAEYTNPLSATNTLKTGLSNDDGFHTYRITVSPAKIVTLYRDAEEIGTFPLSSFYFDNIITNGGFEDGGDDFENAAFFPDFQSKGLLYRIDEPDIDKEAEGYVDIDFVKTGKYALIMNSDGLYESNVGNDNYDPEKFEQARTREFPVKPATKYNVSFSMTRIADEPYAWRDIGGFYDFQPGTQGDTDERDWRAFWNDANTASWRAHDETITTPAEGAEYVANSLRIEFPTWMRGANTTSISAFDNFYLSENIGIIVPKEVPGMVDPVFPEGMVNLIKNGDFEDWMMNNDGSEYEWALSDPNDDTNNGPTIYNPMWNGEIHIQRNDKPDDQIGGEWAHSGQSSVRFSSHGNGGTFAFTVELEANKKYRFNFWHRSPRWGETAWVKVKIGEKNVWGHNLGGNRNNVWTNEDVMFETTDTDKTMCLYADTYSNPDGTPSGWYNIFFDDFVLYEIDNFDDPLLAGKTNLIINGDFEDDTLGNDGEKPYWWALASDYSGNDDNYPVAWSNVWGTYVRLQDKQKVHDTGLNWARSGNNSLRFSYLNDKAKADASDTPDAYRVNMDFKKELEPNKIYTFVFWLKTANYSDRGNLLISNGDELIWKETLSTKYIGWTRQSVSFATTDENHTLRMWTDWTAWYNFYLDDLFLYEDDKLVSSESDNTYLFFGKSTGIGLTDVDIEYVAVNNAGAFAPTGIIKPTVTSIANLNVRSFSGNLMFKALNPASVSVYSVAGVQVARLNVNTEANITLPKGVYIVKSVSKGITETLKVVNK